MMKLEPLQQALRSIPEIDEAAAAPSEKIEDVVGAVAEFSKLLRKAGIQQSREVREIVSSLAQNPEEIREAWQREQQRAAASEQQLRKLAEAMIATLDILDRMLAEMASTNWEAQIRQALDVSLHNVEKAGLVSFGKVGELFDPAIHDLTREIKQRPTVALCVSAVASRGYALNGKVLRRAAVDCVIV
jgi:molecular chaperone GrpE